MRPPPNPSRYDGTATLPKRAGVCDPRSYERKARRDATRSSEEYIRRVRQAMLDHRREELELADRIEREWGWRR